MSDVTRILSQIESGDPSAAEQLLPLVYDELRKLAAAKLAAGRDKDWPFVETMLQYKLVSSTAVQERIALLPISAQRKETLKHWLSSRASESAQP